MKEIPLSKGYVALVDNRDYERVRLAGPWHAIEIGRTAYGRRSIWKIGTQLMHRFILGVTDPKVEVDHEDHNGLNNKRRNLSKTTHTGNQRNRQVQMNSISGRTGVRIQPSGRYRAVLTLKGKYTSLGCFDTAQEADKAVRKGQADYRSENIMTREYREDFEQFEPTDTDEDRELDSTKAERERARQRRESARLDRLHKQAKRQYDRP